jgi:Ca-activated chloride channel family protein
MTPEKVYGPVVETALRTLQNNTTRYGMLSTDLLDSMAQRGPQFLHAVATFEEGVIRTNRDRASQLRWPLVFLFPAGGTYWSNHPYCVLDGADWVSAKQAEAAVLFRDFLAAPEQQVLAVSLALRPIDARTPVTAPLDVASGTIPNARPETVPSWEMPSAASSKAIIDQFINTKRKATVMLVLDVSGSMNGAAIRAATEATAAFIRRLDARDQVGLMTFSDAIVENSPLAPVSSKGDSLPNLVLNLVANGGTNLNGAVCAATERIRARRKADRTAGESRVYGIVLLSDGADTSGEVSENRMLTTCLDSGSEAEPTKIFAIAFGDKAEKGVLEKISAASGGKVFSADPGSIDATYLKISAEQ